MITSECKADERTWISPGAFVCLFVTAILLAVAAQQPTAELEPLRYELAASTMVATRLYSGSFVATDAAAVEGLEGIRDLLRQFSLTGNSRYLRYASARHATLSNGDASTSDWQLLHARLLQAQHRFAETAAVLRQLVEVEPDRIEAWLLLADALRRAGEHAEARATCMRLALVGAADIAQWCAIPLLQMAGTTTADDGRAYRIASSLNTRNADYPPALRRWTLEIIAEAAFTAGHLSEAARYYEEAMLLGESTMALRLAYADTLLRSGRNDRVLELLHADDDNIAALIRVAIASRGLGMGPDVATLKRIELAFAGLTPTAVEDVRLRDKSVYELYYKENPATALLYAAANWQQQKGPEDLALLKNAARAAQTPGAVGPRS